MAALIRDELGLDAEITPGNRGEFTVWVDGNVVAKKTLDGFPEDAACVDAVRQATSPRT